MIISARSPEGAKTIVYNADGTRCVLPIAEYNTETQEAVVYELDENGKVKKSEPVQDPENPNRMITPVVTKTVKLEGSYAVNRETGERW